MNYETRLQFTEVYTTEAYLNTLTRFSFTVAGYNNLHLFSGPIISMSLESFKEQNNITVSLILVFLQGSLDADGSEKGKEMQMLLDI